MHAGVDVPAARAHLVEAERLHLHGFWSPADDSVHADLAVALAVELPHLVSAPVDDDARCPVLQPRWQATLEEVGWFDQVIVDGDDRRIHRARFGLGQEQIRIKHSHLRGSLRARSASMFFCTSVVPAPIEVKRCQG